MPILVDYSTISIGNLANTLLKDKKKQSTFTIDLSRHQIINNIRYLRKMFKEEYGELIIICDSKRNWRKDLFPFYKGNRKYAKNQDIDWNLIYSCVNQIKTELIDNFPFKVIQLDGAEADDIIAVLAKYFHEKNQPVMVCASDNDFKQLSKYSLVQQYSLSNKKILDRIENVEMHLMEKSIRGETGDGIPNILSNDNCLVDKIRQKRCTEKFVSSILSTGLVPEIFKEKYERNRTLIDFDRIPKDIIESIINKYESYPATVNKISKLTMYFVTHKLSKLMDNINDFKE